MVCVRMGVSAAMLVGALFVWGCTEEPKPFNAAIEIPEGEKDPAVWGRKYPHHYDSYLKNLEKTQGYSKYRDDDHDRIGPWPFQFILWDGWGMAVEYNEPNGHVYTLQDQLKVDPSRKKAGGVCLTCKTPYSPELKERLGLDYFQKPYTEVHAQIPLQHRELGLTCVDCHDPKTQALRLSRWTLKEGLQAIGKDETKLTRQELRTLVCAQCHVTYAITKNAEGKSTYVKFPWANGRWGYIYLGLLLSPLRKSV